MNCELWLWLYLWEIWWLACVAKCIGQQCPAIKIEGTMREFAVMNTLRELSMWPKNEHLHQNVSQNMEWMNSKKKNLPNELVLSAANQLPNCVVRSESGVLCRICVVRSESGFRCRIWLVRSDLGVCCWIGVVRSESGVRCWIRVVRKESGVHAELCCPQRIRCSLPNLCGPQRIRGSLLNCVVCNESGVRCRIMLFAGNQVFAAEFVWFAANQVFATELVWSAAN
jgi:hypothetical protein